MGKNDFQWDVTVMPLYMQAWYWLMVWGMEYEAQRVLADDEPYETMLAMKETVQ